MARSEYLKQESIYDLGIVSLDEDDDVHSEFRVSSRKDNISREHVEISDESYVGTVKWDFKANKQLDEVREENWRVNLGGYRRSDEPIPDSYWDNEHLHDEEDDYIGEDGE